MKILYSILLVPAIISPQMFFFIMCWKFLWKIFSQSSIKAGWIQCLMSEVKPEAPTWIHGVVMPHICTAFHEHALYVCTCKILHIAVYIALKKNPRWHIEKYHQTVGGGSPPGGKMFCFPLWLVFHICADNYSALTKCACQ